MPSSVHHFGVAGTGAMLDDQKGIVNANPTDAAGNPVTPAPGVITYSIAPGTAATLTSPNPDSTGLTCPIVGVKGQAGTEVVTVTATNADGTTATDTLTVTITLDPAELDTTVLSPTLTGVVSQ